MVLCCLAFFRSFEIFPVTVLTSKLEAYIVIQNYTQTIKMKCFISAGRIITIPNILALSREELAARARLSDDNITQLYAAISKKLTLYQPCSVYTILNNTSLHSFQVMLLNDLK